MLARLGAQTTAFTYQGHLTDGGISANGIYDFEFTLYGVSTGGAAISPTITTNALSVSNGLFFVTLDFGAGVINGAATWLDIATRANGATDFKPLSPRQLLTPAPTAIFAAIANSASTISGPVPGASLSGAYGGPLNFNNPSNSFAGDGAGLFNVPGTLASQLQAGTSVQALPNTSYVLTNPQTVTITLPAAPNVGDVVRVAGIGAGGWNLAQNAGQVVLAQNLANPLTPWSQILMGKTLQGQTMGASADGTHFIAGFLNFLETSSDSGATWSVPPTQPIINGERAALSADGSHIVVAGAQIYVSSDFGSNWILETNAPTTNYSAIAVSADGSHLVAAVSGGGIYASADFGNHWTLTMAPTNAWSAIASSSNGSKLIAAYSPGGIYASTNFGANWQPTTAPATNLWTALATSADGIRLYGVQTGSNAWFSTDGGQDWQFSSVGGGSFVSVACSADGLRVAAAESGIIMVSSDGGITWFQSNAPVMSWHSVAASAAGNFVTTGYDTGIWALRGNTSTGVNGYLTGGPLSAVEVQYCGNGQFLPISHEGTLVIH
jgi:hypothetical protein